MSAMNEKEIEEMARAERLEYFRNWRTNNKDKVRKHNDNYWKKRAEKKLKAGEANAK